MSNIILPDHLKHLQDKVKPRLVSENFKHPLLDDQTVKDFTGLAPAERVMFGEFYDFILSIVLTQCDQWVAEAFTHGIWFVTADEGNIQLNFHQVMDAMMREHVTKQFWDALDRTPNKFIVIDKGH